MSEPRLHSSRAVKKNLESPQAAASKRIQGLPPELTAMIIDVFTKNFSEEALALNSKFQVVGRFFPEEIMITVTLARPNALSCTSVHASCDFDPKASKPNAQDWIGIEVDAIGQVFELLLRSDKILREAVGAESSNALADAAEKTGTNLPFEWSRIEIDKRRLFVKVDKSNPSLDQLADELLNDASSGKKTSTKLN